MYPIYPDEIFKKLEMACYKYTYFLKILSAYTSIA